MAGSEYYEQLWADQAVPQFQKDGGYRKIDFCAKCGRRRGMRLVSVHPQGSQNPEPQYKFCCSVCGTPESKPLTL